MKIGQPVDNFAIFRGIIDNDFQFLKRLEFLVK